MGILAGAIDMKELFVAVVAFTVVVLVAILSVRLPHFAVAVDVQCST